MSCLTPKNLALAHRTGEILRRVPERHITCDLWLDGPGKAITELDLWLEADMDALCVKIRRRGEAGSMLTRQSSATETFPLLHGDDDVLEFQRHVAQAYPDFPGSLLLLMEFLLNVAFSASSLEARN